jgi:hypothetical protein
VEGNALNGSLITLSLYRFLHNQWGMVAYFIINAWNCLFHFEWACTHRIHGPHAIVIPCNFSRCNYSFWSGEHSDRSRTPCYHPYRHWLLQWVDLKLIPPLYNLILQHGVTNYSHHYFTALCQGWQSLQLLPRRPPSLAKSCTAAAEARLWSLRMTAPANTQHNVLYVGNIGVQIRNEKIM